MDDVTSEITNDFDKIVSGKASTSLFIQKNLPINGEYVSQATTGTPDEIIIKPNIKSYIVKTLNASLKAVSNTIKEHFPNLSKGQYGKVVVNSNKAGFVELKDSTEGNNRWFRLHPSGTYDHIDNEGTVQEKVVKDRIIIIDGNWHLAIDGDSVEVVNGTHKIQIKQDSYTNINGNAVKNVDGDYTTNTTGNKTETVNGDRSFYLEGNQTSEIAGDNTETFDGEHTTDILGDEYKTTLGDVTNIIGGGLIITCNEDVTIAAGGTVTITAPVVAING